MRNLIKRFGAVALSVVMAFSVVSMAFATDDTDTTEEPTTTVSIRDTDNPLVVFDNVVESQPDLIVRKTVSTALDGYTIPDAEFTFTLKWDQDGDGYLEFAGSVSYFLYDEYGVQIKNENTSDGSFKTSSTGQFTLKDGQYAYFEWAGQVEYEITETISKEMSDEFIQIEPAGNNSATGKISEEGTIVTFENMYIPVTETEYTQLAVRKDAIWPDGYDAPDYTDTNFTFEVKIDGSLYANQAYIVYDAEDSGRVSELSRGTTDTDGTFSIQGGQVAVFDDIECGVDYEIREVIDGSDGWQAVGTTEYHGSTSGPIIMAYFADEPTWFAVEKTRTDGITTLDDEFTFTLTANGNSPISGALYYVYDSEGNLVSTGNTTAEDGSFTLKAGQKALFIGLADGTGYTVTEAEENGYNTDSAKSGTVSYDGTEDTFVNEQLTQITIKKMNNTKTTLLEGAKFTVYMKDDNGDYQTYGNNNGVYTTGEDGTFTLTNLQPGEYKIVETKAPDGYSLSNIEIEVTLPYTLTLEDIADQRIDIDSDDFKGLWSETDNCYYLYEITYDVTNNMALMELPNTGSFPWQWVALGVVLAIGVGTTVLYVRKTRKESGATEA